MKKTCFVGFDTSNYTTSAAICTEDGEIVANIKKPLPVASGEKGLRQSDAVFAHVKNLPDVCGTLAQELRGYRVLGVGVSAYPRSVEGSYMPCFLSGVAAAEAFGAAAGAALYRFSHQDGHVMAALYSSGAMDELEGERFLAFHVSGGTTEMMLAHPCGGSFSLELIGETADLNAGQLIDRVGVMLGLDFPCGAELERLAASYDGKIERSRVSVRQAETIECNLSGAENVAVRIYEQTRDAGAVAAFVFDFVGRTLESMCTLAAEKYGELPVLFAGGVMSNKIMRERLGASRQAYFAEPSFSSDNAAGIALLCRSRMMKK